jgi:hypothetical protein
MDKLKRMKLMLFLVLFCYMVFSCKKNNTQTAIPYQNLAVVDGRDPCQYACLVNCPCACGDLYFHFIDTTFTDNIPIDNPGIFKFTTNTIYPVTVKVDWINTTRCQTPAIKITSYQIQ